MLLNRVLGDVLIESDPLVTHFAEHANLLQFVSLRRAEVALKYRRFMFRVGYDEVILVIGTGRYGIP